MRSGKGLSAKFVKFPPLSFFPTSCAHLSGQRKTPRFSIAKINETNNAEKVANQYMSIVILSADVVNVNYKIPALSSCFSINSRLKPCYLFTSRQLFQPDGVK